MYHVPRLRLSKFPSLPRTINRLHIHALGMLLWTWYISIGQIVLILFALYTNNVHLDASAVDGAGSSTADASAYVDVTDTGVAPKTARYDGWQPPDWNLNNSEEGISMEDSGSQDD